jgi:predicted anti-sigma-YlaC factor YlaD
LIDYAQGVLSGTDRQRIEAHLQGNSCGHCRSWIEKAAGLSASAPRPADASAKWDRQAAFRDLQQRLQSLEGAD